MHTSHRLPRVAAVLAFLLLALCPARAGEDVRRAIGAGPMYPLETDKLTATLDRLFEEAQPPAPYPGRLVACIVPHDPYGLSGRVAASAFMNVAPGDYDKVLVLGACHRTIIESCSVPSVAAYVEDRLLRPRLINAGMERPAIDASDFAIVLHELHFNKYDYWIWDAYGTGAPAEVIDLDGVPVASIYRRPKRAPPAARAPASEPPTNAPALRRAAATDKERRSAGKK